jgi:hypothetical protein
MTWLVVLLACLGWLLVAALTLVVWSAVMRGGAAEDRARGYETDRT